LNRSKERTAEGEAPSLRGDRSEGRSLPVLKSRAAGMKKSRAAGRGK